MNINAYSLYGDDFSIQRIEKLVDEALRRKAWLVFYTHDVQSKHSPYGCSVKQFEAVVSTVKARKIDIKTMASVAKDSMQIL